MKTTTKRKENKLVYHFYRSLQNGSGNKERPCNFSRIGRNAFTLKLFQLGFGAGDRT